KETGTNPEQIRRVETTDFSTHIAQCCLKAKELEENGQYEEARSELRDVWQRIGERPDLSQLEPFVAASVLLRAGTLSGWLGSAHQITGAQEIAKDLISESIRLFAQLNEPSAALDAEIDLGICYWRESAFDEARVHLRQIVERAHVDQRTIAARALLNLSVVEWAAARFKDALDALDEAAPYFANETNHVRLGRFRNMRAMAFRNLGANESQDEKKREYFDRALVEYAGARFHFEEAGHHRYIARVDNNVGNLLYNLGRYDEALSHMNRARDLLILLKDAGTVAQINEARAKVFIALKRYTEAEIAATSAVYTLEKGDETSLLAEALITRGIALARMGKHVQARQVLLRGKEVAEQGGDLLRAADAHLTLIEEMREQILLSELARHYEAADRLAGDKPDATTMSRLRACAILLVGLALEQKDAVGIDAFLIGGTLYEEVLHFENELIRRALDQAGGRITVAARLLGTSHQALSAMLATRHSNLIQARTPITPRRRSIKKQSRKQQRSPK
ncbi:MAG TPA: tetratricopeptide repeat protein, partial [Pyrinomonadaceae bacterium]|nr:tetratricopeptide repeat protein [Pyrinomonadaceae bacterium]